LSKNETPGTPEQHLATLGLAPLGVRSSAGPVGGTSAASIAEHLGCRRRDGSSSRAAFRARQGSMSPAFGELSDHPARSFLAFGRSGTPSRQLAAAVSAASHVSPGSGLSRLPRPIPEMPSEL